MKNARTAKNNVYAAQFSGLKNEAFSAGKITRDSSLAQSAGVAIAVALVVALGGIWLYRLGKKE